MYSKPIDNLVSYFKNVYRSVSDKLFPKPGGLELALGYAGFSNVHPDRSLIDNKDITNNIHHFAASNVGAYEDKGNGQIVVRRTSGGKSITLDGKKANGQLEIYVGRELSDEGYKPNSANINKISAAIRKSMQKAGIPLIKKR